MSNAAKAETDARTQPVEHHDDIVTGLRTSLVKFESENADFVAELDLLGMGIDEYETTLASMEPQLVTITNTTLDHDVE